MRPLATEDGIVIFCLTVSFGTAYAALRNHPGNFAAHNPRMRSGLPEEEHRQ